MRADGRILGADAAARARPARLLPGISLSAQATRTLNRWVSLLGASADPLEPLAARLGQALHRPVALGLLAPRTSSGTPLGDGRVILPLELLPAGPGLILDIDSDLAAALVDALLAGEGTPPSVLRPLSDLERGALSYLVLLACRTLEQGTGLQSRLRSLGSDPSGLPAGARLILPVRVGLGDLSGEIRVHLPLDRPLPAEPGAWRPGDLADAVLGSEVRLRAEAGRGTLPWREIGLLAPGDHLFLDSLTVDAKGQGQVGLRCGRGARFLPCQSENAGPGKTRLTLTGPARSSGPHLEKEIMADNTESNDETTADTVSGAPGAAMLDDVPVLVTVELGRLAVSARELLSLRVGHVLELDRTQGEALDVSVNGEAIARGELVEVEGRLGVRIEQLIGR